MSRTKPRHVTQSYKIDGPPPYGEETKKFKCALCGRIKTNSRSKIWTVRKDEEEALETGWEKIGTSWVCPVCSKDTSNAADNLKAALRRGDRV